jgi:hypothetical protein
MPITCRRLNRAMPLALYIVAITSTSPPIWLVFSAAFVLGVASMVMDYVFLGCTDAEEL